MIIFTLDISVCYIQDTQEFGWVDGWPILYTNWGNREPSQLPGEGCVIVGSDAMWDNINCGVTQVSVCKYTSGMLITRNNYEGWLRRG